jgi:hypothetical protein
MSAMKDEAIDLEEATVEADKPTIEAAFVVAIGENGQVYLERNTDALRLEVKREATMIEVRRYISEILMDLQAQAAGEYTLTALMAAQNQPAPAAE